MDYKNFTVKYKGKKEHVTVYTCKTVKDVISEFEYTHGKNSREKIIRITDEAGNVIPKKEW